MKPVLTWGTAISLTAVLAACLVAGQSSTHQKTPASDKAQPEWIAPASNHPAHLTSTCSE